jgi:hypothetical protein
MRPARGAVALSAQFKNFNRPGLICPCAHTIHNRISDTPGWGELEGTGDQITKEAAGGRPLFLCAERPGVSGDGEAAQLPLRYGRTDQTQFST